MTSTRLFTSECVSDGHVDKVCDQISDGILDAVLEQDPLSRVAVEAVVKGQDVYIVGEMTTDATIDVDDIIISTLNHIGYDNPVWGFDPNMIRIHKNISEQSQEIKHGVDNIGAGDQGIMFGYAVKETQQFMPLPIMLARQITKEHRSYREHEWHENRRIGPDAKTQVTVRYADNGRPIEIDTVVLSSLHHEVTDIEYRDGILIALELMCYRAIHNLGFKELITPNTKFLMNPNGPWTVGGPIADAGLTGRKIIVDTYGGASRHGGGAFSGKDPTKVDRSAAYATRHLAKLLCDHLDRHRTEVQVSYAIGIPDPVSVHVYGMHEDQIREIMKTENINLSPSGIIERFDLRRPIYKDTAANGHFGREHLPWEII